MHYDYSSYHPLEEQCPVRQTDGVIYRLSNISPLVSKVCKNLYVRQQCLEDGTYAEQEVWIKRSFWVRMFIVVTIVSLSESKVKVTPLL